MSATPFFSIIMAVYNGEATVLEAITSILDQRDSDWELIIIDDGSTDRTAEKLSLLRDRRIRWETHPNQGAAKARNLAASMATGLWFAFLDADDAWHPDYLSAGRAAISRLPHRIGMVTSGYAAVDAKRRLLHLPPIPEIHGFCLEAVMAQEGLLLPSTTLVHRQVFETVKGFPADCYHEDRAFFLKACRDFPVASTGHRLVQYQQTSDGRCRRILADAGAALTAELSIIHTLNNDLSQVELNRLCALQLRNLACRFMMYGYMNAARRLWLEVPEEVQGGLKSRLVKLSLFLDLNLLQATRVVMQTVMRTVVSPIWSAPDPAWSVLMTFYPTTESARPVAPSAAGAVAG